MGVYLTHAVILLRIIYVNNISKTRFWGTSGRHDQNGNTAAVHLGMRPYQGFWADMERLQKIYGEMTLKKEKITSKFLHGVVYYSSRYL